MLSRIQTLQQQLGSNIEQLKQQNFFNKYPNTNYIISALNVLINECKGYNTQMEDGYQLTVEETNNEVRLNIVLYCGENNNVKTLNLMKVKINANNITNVEYFNQNDLTALNLTPEQTNAIYNISPTTIFQRLFNEHSKGASIIKAIMTNPNMIALQCVTCDDEQLYFNSDQEKNNYNYPANKIIKQ